MGNRESEAVQRVTKIKIKKDKIKMSKTRIVQQVKVWRDGQWVTANEIEHKEVTTVREFKTAFEREVYRVWYTYEVV